MALLGTPLDGPLDGFDPVLAPLPKLAPLAPLAPLAACAGARHGARRRAALACGSVTAPRAPTSAARKRARASVEESLWPHALACRLSSAAKSSPFKASSAAAPAAHIDDSSRSSSAGTAPAPAAAASPPDAPAFAPFAAGSVAAVVAVAVGVAPKLGTGGSLVLCTASCIHCCVRHSRTNSSKSMPPEWSTSADSKARVAARCE